MIQPCITWGTHPVSWYRERIYKIGDDYDPGNRDAALERSMEWGEKMPIGVIYKAEPKEVFADRYRKAVTDRPLPELQPPDREKMLEVLSEFREDEGSS